MTESYLLPCLEDRGLTCRIVASAIASVFIKLPIDMTTLDGPRVLSDHNVHGRQRVAVRLKDAHLQPGLWPHIYITHPDFHGALSLSVLLCFRHFAHYATCPKPSTVHNI